MFCIDCQTSGVIEQEFHIEFNPIVDDEEEDEDDEDVDWHQKTKDSIKRAWYVFTVKKEMKVRKQIEVRTMGSLEISCNVSKSPSYYFLVQA